MAQAENDDTSKRRQATSTSLLVRLCYYYSVYICFIYRLCQD